MYEYSIVECMDRCIGIDWGIIIMVLKSQHNIRFLYQFILLWYKSKNNLNIESYIQLNAEKEFPVLCASPYIPTAVCCMIFYSPSLSNFDYLYLDGLIEICSHCYVVVILTRQNWINIVVIRLVFLFWFCFVFDRI